MRYGDVGILCDVDPITMSLVVSLLLMRSSQSGSMAG